MTAMPKLVACAKHRQVGGEGLVFRAVALDALKQALFRRVIQGLRFKPDKLDYGRSDGASLAAAA